jgi:prepilin-type processing-associated H-X9-DG protein
LGGKIAFKDITDGLSNTFLAGEKHVQIHAFGVGWSDCSLYNGDYPTCCTRSAGPAYPVATSPFDTGWRFGSYHPQVCQFVFADGHVQALPVSTPATTMALLADRSDGQPIPDY